ncbi:MAG: hypothetical protein AABX49_02350 [Nanoarchaeota archaeon]
MNKRGFIRTLEAVLAIVIVFLFIFYAGKSKSGDERFVQGIRSLQESILDEISKDDGFRECVVSANIVDFNKEVEEFDANDCIGDDLDKCSTEIDCYIEGSLPPRYREKYAFTICSPSDPGSCTLPSIKGEEVYTSAVIISSSLNDAKYDPRILRMWLF